MVTCCLRHPSDGQDSVPKPTESSTQHLHPSCPLLESSRGFGPGVDRSGSGSPGLFRPTNPGISPGLTRLTGRLSGSCPPLLLEL
eukprot:scaffold758_cov387-Pavlova_lutheri.AAC.2